MAGLPAVTRQQVVDWMFQGYDGSYLKPEDRVYGCIRDIARSQLKRVEAAEDWKVKVRFITFCACLIAAVAFPYVATIVFLVSCTILRPDPKPGIDLKDKNNAILFGFMPDEAIGIIQEQAQAVAEMDQGIDLLEEDRLSRADQSAEENLANDLIRLTDCPFLFRAAWRAGTVSETVLLAAVETYLKYAPSLNATEPSTREQAAQSAKQELADKLRPLLTPPISNVA